MNQSRYTALHACGLLFTACENPISDDMNVARPESYTTVYTVNAVDDDSKSALTFPLERDTTFRIHANLSCIKNPGHDIRVKFRIAPELVETYNTAHQTDYPMMLEGSYTTQSLETTIPNGKYTSDPVTIGINAAAFDGVGTFLLPIQIESVSPEVPINESLRTAYLRINGTYSANPFPMIDRSGWSIAAFSSEESEPQADYPELPDNGKAVSVIDDSPYSYWGTQWRNAKPGPPHWVVIDMGKTNEIHGVRIRGRATPFESDTPRDNGNPRIFNVELSDDNAKWTAAGTFSVENRIENEVFLDHKASGRYLRITVTATQADMYQTSIADIRAF